jgi:C4-dicarboxylate-specific signal transduction histidine kinase
VSQLADSLGAPLAPLSADTLSRWTGGRRAIAFAALQVIFIWTVAALDVWQAHRVAVDEGKKTVENIGLMASAYVNQSLSSADLVLKSILDWISEHDIISEEQFRQVVRERQVFDAMRSRLTGLPQIGGTLIVAKDGEVLNATQAYPAPPLNLSDQPFFREQLDPSASAVALSAAIQIRPTGTWRFVLARKVTSRSDKLLGVVFISLESAYLADFFRQIARGTDGEISLFRLDGTLLSTSSRAPGLLGRRFEDVPAPQAATKERFAKAHKQVGPRWSDGKPAYASLQAQRRLEAFPAFVSVEIGEALLLADWRSECMVVLVTGTLLTAVTLFALWRFLRMVKLNEIAYRASAEHQLMAAIVETPSALTAVVDRTGTVVRCNRRFRAMVCGESKDCTLDSPSVMGFDALMAFATGTGGPTGEVDLDVAGPNETISKLHFLLSRQSFPGAGDCVIMVGHDDTRRQDEQRVIAQTAKLVALGEMTSGIAHELSQPLNVIRMSAQNALTKLGVDENDACASDKHGALQGDEMTAYATSKFERVVAQVDRAAAILARMRVIGRATKEAPMTFDIRSTCRAALASVKSQFAAAGITVTESLGEESLDVLGHQTLIERAIINLLINAADAMGGVAPPSRTVRVGAYRGPTGRISVCVADSGHGVPVAIRERIFEPFFTTRPEALRTGLGLAMAFGIARDEGGTVALVPGEEGATFVIELPSARPEDPVS